MSDEGFHEIQLNGKQLVFLFMASTVVAVVIFLCGVMVGRGVAVAPVTASAVEPDGGFDSATADPTAPGSSTAPVESPGTSAPLDNAAPPAQETLTYTTRLEDTTAPPETLREPMGERRDTPPSPQRSQREPAASAATAATVARADAATREPAGNGFVVQVAAVRDRAEADAIAKRLSSKGYASFVTTPGTGAARVFRVRVGKFNDRREAESVASRLQKEEQFKPWITR